MDRQECVQVIRNECLAKNGFLIRLRGGDLLISGYDNLKAALINYKGIIGNEEFIERIVAYCLHFLKLELMAATEYFPKTIEETDLIHKINAEVSFLIETIFTPSTLMDSFVD